MGALFLMRDFGTACIFFVTFLIIAFMRSGSVRTIALICSAAVFGVFLILKFKPYIAQRFAAWRHVWEFANEAGYQQTRVLTYTASGGFFGVGVGNGYLKSVFASTSDLVFGMICEELGLILAITVVVAIALLVLLCAFRCDAQPVDILFHFRLCGGRNDAFSDVLKCLRRHRCPTTHRCNPPLCQPGRVQYGGSLGTIGIH